MWGKSRIINQFQQFCHISFFSFPAEFITNNPLFCHTTVSIEISRFSAKRLRTMFHTSSVLHYNNYYFSSSLPNSLLLIFRISWSPFMLQFWDNINMNKTLLNSCVKFFSLLHFFYFLEVCVHCGT